VEKKVRGRGESRGKIIDRPKKSFRDKQKFFWQIFRDKVAAVRLNCLLFEGAEK